MNIITQEKQRLAMIVDQLAHLDTQVAECDEQLAGQKKDVPVKHIVLAAITVVPSLVLLIFKKKILGFILLAVGIYFVIRLLQELAFDRKFYKRVARRREEYVEKQKKLESQAAQCRQRIDELSRSATD